MWASWYGKNHLQVMTLAALIWGMGMIVLEGTAGTLGYILFVP